MSARGTNLTSDDSYRRVWSRARVTALSADEYRSQLARRPYDLRHACLSTWLNAGVPTPQSAEWAGHSVEMLLRVYAKCLDGQHEIARRRIAAASPTPGDQPVVVHSRVRETRPNLAPRNNSLQLMRPGDNPQDRTRRAAWTPADRSAAETWARIGHSDPPQPLLAGASRTHYRRPTRLARTRRVDTGWRSRRSGLKRARQSAPGLPCTESSPV